MLVGLKFWYCLVLEWWALFCFTSNLGFLTPARKQLPEYSQHVKFSTHRPCCECVSDTGEGGLLWGTGRCLSVRTITGPSKGMGWNWGWPSPLSMLTPTSELFQGSRGVRVRLRHHGALAPVAGCIRKLLLLSLLTWTESLEALMCSRLADKEPPRLSSPVRLTLPNEPGWPPLWTSVLSSVKWRLGLCTHQNST